ncbi:hypothetical protein DV451_000068 [Geotrichum candidum]|uniref:FAD dependent oxidoreductase domain-containing protein n=1 Tax=Geotrichum candidum TaxID=1173061 RepID=A0A9P5GBD3_GEOCN|nr:hypothetical protein DV451_000068 [Geotrichum candidum]
MGAKIVIVGAGIIGLYTAFILTRRNGGKGDHITVLAQHFPGDQSINYTSPWAGGNFSIISGDDPKSLLMDKLSFQNLTDIFNEFGDNPAAGLARLPTTELWAEKPPSDRKVNSLKEYVPDLHIMSPEELPSHACFGLQYTTFNFFSPKFIGFLKDYLSDHGVTFVRRELAHIDEAFTYDPSTEAVFNATGIGARNLPGVADEKVYPTRGQIVVVRAPQIQQNATYWSPSENTYIIPRPHSGGLVVLGGYLQKNNWNGDTLNYESVSILERTRRLLPDLLKPGTFEIIRDVAGLRPSREGGVRIEREDRADGKILIHNYGAGGTGYQAGYGMALTAVNLLYKTSKL